MFRDMLCLLEKDKSLIFSHVQHVIYGIFSDFFIELDRHCKPLTLHSTLKDLVKYVRAGIQRVENERSS